MTAVAKTADWISPEECLEGEKWAKVRDEREIQATVMRRASSGWETEALWGTEAILKLPDSKIEIPLARIYERTALPQQTS